MLQAPRGCYVLSGGCNVALCLSWFGLHLSSNSAGKILVMRKIQKYKIMNLVTELIPVNAKMSNCFLLLARLGKKKQKIDFQCHKWNSSQFSNMSIFISQYGHEAQHGQQVSILHCLGQQKDGTKGRKTTGHDFWLYCSHPVNCSSSSLSTLPTKAHLTGPRKGKTSLM